MSVIQGPPTEAGVPRGEQEWGEVPERGDVRLACRVPDGLRRWNDVGVVISADVHVARRLAALGGEDDDAVLLGAALAVRALRLGHVCVDLASVARTVSTDVAPEADLSQLPWPEQSWWRSRLADSPLVADGDLGLPGRPLRLVGSRLYLDRYWRQECQVAADLSARDVRFPHVDIDVLVEGLDRLWPAGGVGSWGAPDLQRSAAQLAVTRGFAVIAGGPGTGKTTTVARILALLREQAEAKGGPPPRVALGAPTGKAAARLQEAVHAEALKMAVTASTRSWLLSLSASTLHRLLGRRPDSESRFRHDRRQRLPHDTVIVDETSMVSLSLMANLLEAVRPDARLVLVGDPEQLASVEAGAVLGDIVGPAAGRRETPASGTASKTEPAAPGGTEPAAGSGLEPAAPAGTEPAAPGGTEPAISRAIVVLRRVHRFGGGIAEMAAAIQAGDADRAVDLARAGSNDLILIDSDAHDGPDLEPVRRAVVSTFRAVTEAADDGDGLGALRRLGGLRVLCARRQGPAGTGAWTAKIEAWLGTGLSSSDSGVAWYLGRPLLVTANDYELQLFNGDTGVIARAPDGRAGAAFERGGALTWTAPARLRAVQTVYAMTVHKSQGSQFDDVVVILPGPSSAILTRQLLYTAVTRARRRVTLVGSDVALRAAVDRPIARASGLQDRLWGAGGSLG